MTDTIRENLEEIAPFIAAVLDVVENGGRVTFGREWNTPERDAAELWVLTYRDDDGSEVDATEAETTLQYVMENFREQLSSYGVDVPALDKVVNAAAERDALRQRLQRVYKSIWSVAQRVTKMDLTEMKGKTNTLWWSIMGSLGGMMESMREDPLLFSSDPVPDGWTPREQSPDMTQYSEWAQSEPLELMVKGYARTFARDDGYDTIYYIVPNRPVVPIAWRLAPPESEPDESEDYSDYADLPPEGE